jgi:alkylation response protein AidB-like acyl-CoA dehydrogenase
VQEQIATLAGVDIAVRAAVLDRLSALRRTVIAEYAVAADRGARFPTEGFAALHEAGLLELALPREYGGADAGLGGDVGLLYAAIAEIARACPSTALCFGHHSYVATIVRFLGDEPFRRCVFADITDRGALLASAGSEFGPMGMQTVARADAYGYVLDGRKRYASLAGAATWYMVWTMAEGSDDVRTGLLLAMVGRDAPGFSVIENWTGVGMRGSATHSLTLDGVRVPAEHALGPPGAYFDLPLMGPFWHGQFAANFTGTARGALDFALEYVRTETRPAYRLESVAEDPFIRHRLADLFVQVRASEALVERAAAEIAAAQAAEDPARVRDAALTAWSARTFAHETAQRVTSDIFQVCGARATLGRHDADRYWRDFTTFSLHDPVDSRLSAIGLHLLTDREYVPTIV